MLNERMAAATALRMRIRAAKLAANTSLIETGNLLTALGEASISTGLYAAGQPAIEKALAMAEAAATLRGLAGETHLALAEVRTKAGLDHFAAGDDEDCPAPDVVRSRLRVAA